MDKDWKFQNLQGKVFTDVDFSEADFTGSCLQNACFQRCSLQRASFFQGDLQWADFRGCDLRGADLRGANCYGALFEGAFLEEVISDHETAFFRSICPPEGAFLGYKKAVDHLMVQLLIPAQAKRSNATTRACRCERAKVLSIQDREGRRYPEAESLAKEGFFYRVGAWVTSDSYEEDRFAESSHGIHFWLTPEEAWDY